MCRNIDRAANTPPPRANGWLARASSGGSVRANSVSALDYTGSDLDASLARVVDFYRARGARARFKMTDVARPQGLDTALATRGWTRHGEHVTMACDVTGRTSEAIPDACGTSVVSHDQPTAEWYRVYLQGLSNDRRVIAPRLVERVPAPRCFFTAEREGAVIASGLSVLDGELASVQCMATLPEARRSGAASAVLAAIGAYAREQGARRLYLQAEAENVAAITLYRRVGFAVVG